MNICYVLLKKTGKVIGKRLITWPTTKSIGKIMKETWALSVKLVRGRSKYDGITYTSNSIDGVFHEIQGLLQRFFELEEHINLS